MKIMSLILAASLAFSGAAFSATKRSIETEWYLPAGATSEIPIQFKANPDDSKDAVVMLYSESYCDSDYYATNDAHFKVTFNGKPVFHGEDVSAGNSLIFLITENGVLSIKNISTKDCDIFGFMTLQIN